MDSVKIQQTLTEKYPNKNIILLPSHKPTEMICEIEPTTEHEDHSVAIAVIDGSKPHLHHLATERYEVLHGTLLLHVGDQMYTLKSGESYTVTPETIHWAEGDSTVVKVTSHPGWTQEDHILA